MHYNSKFKTSVHLFNLYRTCQGRGAHFTRYNAYALPFQKVEKQNAFNYIFRKPTIAEIYYIKIRSIALLEITIFETWDLRFQLKTKYTRAISKNVNKTQYCDMSNNWTENFIISIQFFSSKLYVHMVENIE